MGVNCFVFSFAGKSCGIMNKMFDNIEPEEDTIKPKNGKLTICTIHYVSILKKYNGPDAETLWHVLQCRESIF
jgi:hypothetical protein